MRMFGNRKKEKNSGKKNPRIPPSPPAFKRLTYTYPSWPSLVQKMQYEQGDVLLCDVTVPAGIDPDAGAAPPATSPPKVLPEQLLQRTVVKTFGGLATILVGTHIKQHNQSYRRKTDQTNSQ